MYKNCITDVPGIKVGQASHAKGLTGCTIFQGGSRGKAAGNSGPMEAWEENNNFIAKQACKW